MKLSAVLSASAVYLAIVGILNLFAPAVMTFGVVDASASSGLLFTLRIPASMAIGIAILNWMARNAEASVARKAVVTANIVGFSLATVIGIWGGVTGAPSAAWGFVVINAVIAVGFILSPKA